MGRPLNKKYFQGGSGYTIGCSYHDGTGVVDSVIVRQRSNTKYEVLGSAGTTPTKDWTNVSFVDNGVAGYQVVDVGGAKAGGTATGLANDATVYTAAVVVDGGASQPIAVTGSAAQTYTTLIAELDADTTGASWSIVGGNLRCTSDTTGTSSTIAITDTDLFATLTDFVAIDAAVAGTAGTADTITKPDGSTWVGVFAQGDFIRIENATVTANNGVYEIASVTANEITLTADAELTGGAPDAAATIELITADSVVVAQLVDGTPTALGEMQVLVTPETGSPASTSARIINAHTVKCFNDVTYAWNPTDAGNFRGIFEEATLQAATS